MRKASLVAQMVKNLPAMQETWVQFLGWEDPLAKGMATHSSTLAWEIPWTEEPGWLQSMGPQRVRHNWATNILWNSGCGTRWFWWMLKIDNHWARLFHGNNWLQIKESQSIYFQLMLHVHFGHAYCGWVAVLFFIGLRLMMQCLSPVDYIACHHGRGEFP